MAAPMLGRFPPVAPTPFALAWRGTSSDQASLKLRSSFFHTLRFATVRRLVELLTILYTKRLRLGFGYLERSMQAQALIERRAHMIQRSQQQSAELTQEMTKEMEEVSAKWSAQRAALLKAWGVPGAGGRLPEDSEEAQTLRRLDMRFQAKLQGMHQEQQETARHLDVTCKRLRTECNASLLALSLPPCVDANAGVHGRDLPWTVESPELHSLLWSHASGQPDLRSLSYVAAAEMEEQRRALSAPLFKLFEQLDHLQGLPETTSAASTPMSTVQPQHRSARPYHGAQVLKSALRRCQRRTLRPVFHKLLRGTAYHYSQAHQAVRPMIIQPQQLALPAPGSSPLLAASSPSQRDIMETPLSPMPPYLSELSSCPPGSPYMLENADGPMAYPTGYGT